MNKIIIVIFLFSPFWLRAQNSLDSASKFATYVSKTKTYQIQYDAQHWQIDTAQTIWDTEFHDVHNLLKVYFSAFNYFVPERKLKETLKSQYKEIGSIKKLTIYKKKLSHMEVDYFECELKYKGYMYKYQGFIFNGQNGAMELQFGGQDLSIERNQKSIDEFCNGVAEIE